MGHEYSLRVRRVGFGLAIAGRAAHEFEVGLPSERPPHDSWRLRLKQSKVSPVGRTD